MNYRPVLEINYVNYDYYVFSVVSCYDKFWRHFRKVNFRASYSVISECNGCAFNMEASFRHCSGGPVTEKQSADLQNTKCTPCVPHLTAE